MFFRRSLMNSGVHTRERRHDLIRAAAQQECLCGESLSGIRASVNLSKELLKVSTQVRTVLRLEGAQLIDL